MPQFPSEEWMDAFCREVVAQPGAADLARALDGAYRFVIEPSGPLSETRAYDIEIRPEGDGGVRARRLETPVAEPRLVLTATYDRWKQLVSGRLDIGMAVMLRRLKVSGDTSRVVREVGSTRPLVHALRQVDSVWLDG